MGVHIADADAPRQTEEETVEENTGTETKSIIPDIDPGDETTQEEGDDTQSEGDDAAEETDEEKAPEESDVDFGAVMEGWTDEFVTNGELSQETRAAVLESVFTDKVPAELREMILDTYLQGQSATRAVLTQEAYSLVGGEESYKQMLQWGVDHLTEEEVQAFDADVLGGDPVRRKAAIKGLYAQMQQNTGSDSEPDLTHSGGRAHGEPIIASRSELVRIMQTKEYQTDPAVREKVARQMKQSMATGKYISD